MLGACAPAFTMVVLMVVLSLIYWLFELFAKTLLERMVRFLKNAGVTFTFQKKGSFLYKQCIVWSTSMLYSETHSERNNQR